MSFLNVLPFQRGDPRSINDQSIESHGRYKIVARRKSVLFWRRVNSVSCSTAEDNEESTWLLSSIITHPKRQLVAKILDSWSKRMIALYILPTGLILIYAAIPFPLYVSERNGQVSINFWYFLFVFYGIYNGVGLLWITKLFNLFSVNWWPTSLGGLLSFFLFWSISLGIGSLTYILKNDWGTLTLTWSMLTLCTMLGPIIFGFFYIRRLHLDRAASRDNAMNSQEDTPFSTGTETFLPHSYTRFLWFTLLLAIGLGSFALGEAYAWFWLATLPHTSADVLLYVYTWIGDVLGYLRTPLIDLGLIYTLDFLTALIIDRQIDSPSLIFMYKLYYALTHQIYVRNLYARLRSPQQFAVIQGASSFVTIIVAPIVMHTCTYRIVCKFTTSETDLTTYRNNAARGLYLKAWAANTTMAAFLGWVTILHFGPNRPAYPYFDFTTGDNDDDLYSWQLTFTASSIVWVCEILSHSIAKQFMRWFYALDVDKAMRHEMTLYPDLLPSGIVLTLFVLMNMLMSTVQLTFH